MVRETWENMMEANVEKLRSCQNSGERSQLLKGLSLNMICDVVVQLGVFKKLNYAGAERQYFMLRVTKELDNFFQA